MSENRKKRGYFLLLILVPLLVGLYFSKPAGLSSAVTEKTYKNVKIFVHALDVVQKNYVEKVDEKKLIYGAIKGMLNILDVHSSFLTPEDFKEFQVETSGQFGGLGIEITIKDGVLTVIAPIEDTPAYRAGIKGGDQIIKINGEPTKGMTLMEAVGKMRGPKGTKITITIKRKGVEKPIDFTIIRDIIHVKSIKSRLIENRYAYIKIRTFQEDTANELAKAIEDLKNKSGGKIRGLILDVRNNPGGLLDQAVKVADLFLEDGAIVKIKGRIEEQNKEFHATKPGTYTGFPMIVLVNGSSASASEIVAGALQDHHRAVVLGTRTFGKGSVQTIIALEDGSGLKLTTARYYTPSGKSIQAVGIKPDIVVEAGSAPLAEQEPTEEEGEEGKLKRIREEDLPRHLREEETAQKEKKQEEIKDVQLNRAVELLKSWEIFRRTP